MTKPTIHELEALLDAEGRHVRIEPDGSLTRLAELVNGPPQQFSAPDWPTFLEQRWTRFLAEQMRVGTTHEEAFRAGWYACMDELGQKEPSREDVALGSEQNRGGSGDSL